MERASFLIEGGSASGRRLDCLFNPNEVVMERVSGIRSRSLAGGRISGRAEVEDPLLYTGGGETRITLKLLFDTTRVNAPSALGSGHDDVAPRLDVRRKTRALWDMAEGASDDIGGDRELPRGRFLWGKAWNIPVAVLALAERLDHFEPDGTPLRSWVHIRLRKLPERTEVEPWPDDATLAIASSRVAAFELEVFIVGGYTAGPATIQHIVQPGDRLTRLAARYYNAAHLWRVIAVANGIDDPSNLEVGRTLLIPPQEEIPAGGIVVPDPILPPGVMIA